MYSRSMLTLRAPASVFVDDLEIVILGFPASRSIPSAPNISGRRRTWFTSWRQALDVNEVLNRPVPPKGVHAEYLAPRGEPSGSPPQSLPKNPLQHWDSTRSRRGDSNPGPHHYDSASRLFAVPSV